MYKMIRNVFLFGLFLIIISCSQNKLSTHKQVLKNDDIYVVDLDDGEKKESLFLSSLFKNVKCIQLEATDDSFIGRIEKFLVYNNMIYVLDATIANSLLVFDIKGTFYNKIGNRGSGPEEYNRIIDFTIDTDKDEIIIVSDRCKMIFFDILSGQYKKTLITEPNYPITTIQYYNNILFTDLHEHPKADDKCLIQSINMSDGKQINTFLRINEYNKGFNDFITAYVKYFLPAIEPPFLFRQVFMDTFFSLTPNGLSPFLTVKSKYFASESDAKEMADYRNNLLKNPNFLSDFTKKNIIYILYGYFNHNDFIHFNFSKGGDIFFVQYNILTGKTTIYEKVINDLLYENQNTFGDFNASFFDRTGVFECIDINKIPLFAEFLKNNKINDSIKYQLKDLTEESNPIIFHYEYK